MDKKLCPANVTGSQVGIEAIQQYIVEALNCSAQTLAKVKEIKISLEPVVAYRIDIVIIPEK
jgi:hypothetical protein